MKFFILLLALLSISCEIYTPVRCEYLSDVGATYRNDHNKCFECVIKENQFNSSVLSYWREKVCEVEVSK